MFRKLISGLSIAFALVASTVVGQPAQAVGPSILPYRFDVVALKALPHDRAFILGYIPNDRGLKDFVGYPIGPDGTLGDQVVFEQDARMAVNAIEVSPITLFSDGTIGLAWVKYNDINHSSTLNVRFSADGSAWSSIYHPAPTQTNCTISDDSCRYATPRVAQDGKGQVAVAYGIKAQFGKAFVSVSKDKSTWSSPLVQTYPGYGPKVGFIYGLSAGGFETGGLLCYQSCSYWISTIDPKATKFSAKGSFVPVWGSNISYAEFGQVQMLNPTTAVIPIAAMNNDFAFSWVTFSTVTGKWAALKTLKIPGSSIYFKSPVSAADAEGRFTFVFSTKALDVSRNQTGRNNYFKITFEPGSLVATSTLVGDAPSETPPAIARFRNLYLDADNQFHLVMDLGAPGSAVDTVLSQDGLNHPQTISQLRSGEVYSAVTTTSGDQITSVTSDGSIFYSLDENHLQLVNQSDRPRLTSPITIVGKNQMGATLTAASPRFVGHSPVDSVTMDWYSCTTANVALVFGQIPSSCHLISTGSSNTYKLKPAEKAKYVAVSATAHIGQLSTTVLSKTTLKIK
ncbi:MAG: hypothetical protein RLZZ06_410 [Actinomycetota bacterium]